MMGTKKKQEGELDLHYKYTWTCHSYLDLLDSGLLGCDARLMLASLKGPQPTLFLARTLYW